MKRFVVLLISACAIWATLVPATECQSFFTFGCPRDGKMFTCRSEAQCHFPPLLNPCAAPCRPPGLQAQAVPCPFRTACPSLLLPDYGISYGQNPYPLFNFR